MFTMPARTLVPVIAAGGLALAPPPAPKQIPATPPVTDPAPPVPGSSAARADPAAPAFCPAPDELVTVQRGSIPIIITAPHGGSVRVPGSADRTRGVLVRDVNTAEIAQLVAQRLTARLGGKPYLVVAQFSRKDADANRAPDEAFENDAARRQYEAFHRYVRQCVDECRRDHPAAILIDLHGQVREPEAVVRGTRNGLTVSALVKRRGEAAVTGPRSIFGALKASGYRVIPDVDADEPEPNLGRETFFDGGFIVARYGSHNADGVDAVQIELGAMRSNRPWQTAADLADAIATFSRAYLPAGQAHNGPDDAGEAPVRQE